jgi:RNA polymerase sigma factor (sigma-70 family)
MVYGITVGQQRGITMADDRKTLLERLYAQYATRLRSFLYRRVGRHSVAQELAQEVYLRLMRLEDLSTILNPEAYLFTVASNLATEHQLRERARGHALDIDDPAVQAQLAELPSVPAQLDDEQRLRRLREVLTQLPRKCQDTVMLRHRYGLSYEQIGQRLGISTNMVKKYLSQALAHCRRRMKRLE